MRCRVGSSWALIGQIRLHERVSEAWYQSRGLLGRFEVWSVGSGFGEVEEVVLEDNRGPVIGGEVDRPGVNRVVSADTEWADSCAWSGALEDKPG
jgi:hypothetical protein